MARTVLGIVGSPRRDGNTHVLVRRALRAAESVGATVVELFLADLTIRECDGCHACWRGHACTKQDDMPGVFESIAACDAIVFGTPVYWYGPTGLMKMALDRFVYFNCPANRTKIARKQAALVVPFEEHDFSTAGPLVDMFEKSFHYLQLVTAGVLLAPGVGRKGEAARMPAIMQQAEELGRKLGLGAR
jgi:multimeric flavodoxin WrbA